MHFFSRNWVKFTLKWVKSIFFYKFFSSKWLCPEAIVWRYSVKRCSQKFLKTSKKTHHKSLQFYKKETEIFSRTFWEFFENGYFTEYLRTTVSSTPDCFFPVLGWESAKGYKYMPGDNTNLYSFIQGSLEWLVSELFSADISLYNHYKYIVFNIFSCRIVIISYKMLIIIGVSNAKINN